MMAEGRGRSDWAMLSSLMALTANCHRDPKRRAQPFRAGDFSPYGEAAAKREPDIKAPISVLKMFLPKDKRGSLKRAKRRRKG